MILSEIFKNIKHEAVSGDTNIDIRSVAYDSRKVEKGSLFVCLKGYNADGHKYAQSAVDSGAAALVVSDDVEINGDAAIIKVDDTREALAHISAEFFGNPAKELTTIAITGTKGKTTTVAMIKRILEVAGIKVLAANVPNLDMNGLRNFCDKMKAKLSDCVVVLASVIDGKVNLVAAASDSAMAKGAHAGNLIKEIASLVGGGGGGRPNMAQAGGKDPSGVDACIAKAKEVAVSQLS